MPSTAKRSPADAAPALPISQLQFLGEMLSDEVDLGDESAVPADLEGKTPKPVDPASLLAIIEYARLLRQRSVRRDRIACTVAMPFIAGTFWFLTFLPSPARAAFVSLPADEWQPLRVLGECLALLIVCVIVSAGIDVLRNFARQRRAAREAERAALEHPGTPNYTELSQ